MKVLWHHSFGAATKKKQTKNLDQRNFGYILACIINTVDPGTQASALQFCFSQSQFLQRRLTEFLRRIRRSGSHREIQTSPEENPMSKFAALIFTLLLITTSA